MTRFIESLENRCLLSLAADANADHVIDTLDFQVVAVNFNHVADKAHGDFTGDGKCNALDFNALADEFGHTEPIEMANNNFSDLTASHDWNDPDAWSLGHIPTNTETAIVDHGTYGGEPVQNSGGASNVGAINIIDGGAQGLSLTGITCLGVCTATNTGGLTLTALGDNLTVKSTSGAVAILSWTGSGKTITSDTNTLNLTGSANIPASYSLVSVSNGTIDFYAQNVSGGTNPQFSGLGSTVAKGATYSVGITAARWGAMASPFAQVTGHSGDIAVSWSAGIMTFTMPEDTTAGTNTVILTNGDGSYVLTLDTITVTAASTTVPQARLGIRLGIGI